MRLFLLRLLLLRCRLRTPPNESTPPQGTTRALDDPIASVLFLFVALLREERVMLKLGKQVAHDHDEEACARAQDGYGEEGPQKQLVGRPEGLGHRARA